MARSGLCASALFICLLRNQHVLSVCTSQAFLILFTFRSSFVSTDRDNVNLFTTTANCTITFFSFLFFSHPRVSSGLHTMQSAREKKRLGPPAGAYSLPHRRKKKIPNQYHILTCTLTLLPYMYIHFFSIFSFPTSLHFFFLLYNLVLGRRDAFYSSRRRSLGVYAVLVHLIIASVDRTFIEGCMRSCKIVGGAN